MIRRWISGLMCYFFGHKIMSREKIKASLNSGSNILLNVCPRCGLVAGAIIIGPGTIYGLRFPRC